MSKTKNKVSYLVATFFIVSIGIFFLWLYNAYTVPIVVYHLVDYSDEEKANWVTPENFEYQFEYFKEVNCFGKNTDDPYARRTLPDSQKRTAFFSV